MNVCDSNNVFFVIRHKKNRQFNSIKENELPENRRLQILIDVIIELKNQGSNEKIAQKLRRVGVLDDVYKQTNKLSQIIRAGRALQISYRNQEKCLDDSNIGCFDKHFFLKGIEVHFKVLMALVKSGCFYMH